jgi:Uncharacterized conserved protein
MDKSNDQKITILVDGPYQVSGGITLNRATIVCDDSGVSVAWEVSEAFPTPGESYNLCRCGHSQKRPYCDGNHRARGFKGREKAGRPPYTASAKRRQGPQVDLLDDPSLCVGARFCDRGPTVWRLVENGRDNESLKMAVEEACACPAGRLTIVDSQGQLLEPELPLEISLVEDPANNCRGPLWVKGGVPMEGKGGDQYETRNRVSLCRCGESANMPYCDASHYDCPHMRELDERPAI